MTQARRIAAIALTLPLAAFFAFVGWHKTVDSLADLARYHAWTVWLPERLGRLVGLGEIACAAGLLAGVWRRRRRLAGVAALVLVANQAIAAAIHARHGETGALPQNAVLIALLALLAMHHRLTADPA